LTRGNSRSAKQLGSQAALFLLGNVFTLVVGLPLQVYLARVLGSDGIGAFSLIEGSVSLIAGLIAFGQAPALVKFIPFHLERAEYACIRTLLRDGARILLVAGCVTYVIVVAVYPVFVKHWPAVAPYRAEMSVMAALIPLSLISFYLQQGLRGFQEIRYIVIGSSFLQLTVKAVLAVVLLTAGLHLIGYIWAVVLSVAIAAAWMALGLRRKVTEMPADACQHCETDHRSAWRTYARVMYSGSLLGVGGTYIDRFLLGALAGVQPVGVLAVVKQIQQMPVIFQQMFLSVAAPMFSAAHARGAPSEMQHIYHLTTDWVVRLSMPLFIFAFIFAAPLLRLFGPQFAAEGTIPLQVLLASQLVNLAFGPVGSVMYMSGMERRAVAISVYQMVVSVLALCVLIPAFGLVGASFAMCVSILFVNVFEFVVARKQIGLRWSDGRYLRWIVPTLASLAAALIVRWAGPAEVGAVLLAAYLGCLYAIYHGISLIRGLHDDDRVLLRHFRDKFAGLRT